MTKKKRLLAISGSIRNNSTNLKIIKALADLSSEFFEIKIHEELAKLPYFNPDLDKGNPPEIVEKFRNEISNADGILICTPEYVFSLPGVLKNAFEWMVSTTIFLNKHTAVITASASGEKAHESLLLVLKTLGARLDEGSALLIQGVRAKINDQGKFSDERTLIEIKKLIEAFKKALDVE